jgi:hypothetical protein
MGIPTAPRMTLTMLSTYGSAWTEDELPDLVGAANGFLGRNGPNPLSDLVKGFIPGKRKADGDGNSTSSKKRKADERHMSDQIAVDAFLQKIYKEPQARAKQDGEIFFKFMHDQPTGEEKVILSNFAYATVPLDDALMVAGLPEMNVSVPSVEEAYQFCKVWSILDALDRGRDADRRRALGWRVLEYIQKECEGANAVDRPLKAKKSSSLDKPAQATSLFTRMVGQGCSSSPRARAEAVTCLATSSQSCGTSCGPNKRLLTRVRPPCSSLARPNMVIVMEARRHRILPLGSEDSLPGMEGRWKCFWCPKEFGGERAKSNHEADVHRDQFGDEQWECHRCDRRFGSKGAKYDHDKDVHRKHRAAPPLPFDGAQGDWVGASHFKGRTSFGWFVCPCTRTWLSAYAQKKYKQRCSTCKRWLAPVALWTNSHPEQRDKSRAYVERGEHRSALCEACRRGDCPR